MAKEIHKELDLITSYLNNVEKDKTSIKLHAQCKRNIVVKF